MSELELLTIEAIEYYRRLESAESNIVRADENGRIKCILHRLFYRAKKNEKRIRRGAPRKSFETE